MTTPSERLIFDIVAATAARDEAIDRVERNADPGWNEAAYDAVCRVALLRPEGFTTDDVWPLIENGDGTHEPRAMGPVMRRARLAGVIVPTDDFRASGRVVAHRNPKRIWRAA